MITVGIVGGTGYTGGELLRLAFAHPALDVTQVTSRNEVGAPLSTLWPQLEGRSALRFTAPEVETLRQCDLVFFATPNGTAMTMVPALLDAAVKVVDLSADFRLRDLDAWERWYGMPHACPELVDNAVYGLPECHRDAVREASLIANPGCYPTAVLLALVPLLERELIDPQHLIADAKSGVSGAGRKTSLSVLHGEVAENFRAYGVGGHRHQPEISQQLDQCGAGSTRLTFTPHLVPMFRGLQATVYADTSADSEALRAAFEDRYAAHSFVHLLPQGMTPETRSVRGTNYCQLALWRQPENERLIVLSVIDNLVKGAAGQAIQNANLMFSMAETEGLDAMPFFP